jgi:hypothetical protein
MQIARLGMQSTIERMQVASKAIQKATGWK